MELQSQSIKMAFETTICMENNEQETPSSNLPSTNLKYLVPSRAPAQSLQWRLPPRQQCRWGRRAGRVHPTRPASLALTWRHVLPPLVLHSPTTAMTPVWTLWIWIRLVSIFITFDVFFELLMHVRSPGLIDNHFFLWVTLDNLVKLGILHSGRWITWSS